MPEPTEWPESAFRQIVESAPDGMLIADRHGQIVFANLQAEALFGYGAGELLGQQVETLVPESRREAHAATREAYIDRPRVRRIGTGLDLWGKRRDGTEIPLDISLSPLAGNAEGLTIAAIRDISLQRHAEQVLRHAEERERLMAELQRANQRAEDARAEAERANNAKSLFLANMSHELRTPLNAILGFADLLEEHLADTLTERDSRYLSNVRGAGEHLLVMINDLLDLARAEANKIELRIETVALRDLVGPTLDGGRVAAEQAALEFCVSTVPDIFVTVDPARVRQILYNLVGNAVKFTRPHGLVEVTVRTEGADLLIDVRDTGVGIPEEEQHKLFAVFERLQGAETTPGSGLGLALTKRLVERHGGVIGFESKRGAGTTFHVRLPHVAYGCTTGKRLLIVEDERSDAELLVSTADDVGIECEVVSSVERALAALQREPPLAIALDLRLPGGRGEEVLAMAKGHPGLRHIPVMVVSVENDHGVARRLGAEDHLTKPLDRNQLAEWLRQVVRARTA